jgi:hypothetical protein
MHRNREHKVLDSGGLDPGSFGKLVSPLIANV